MIPETPAISRLSAALTLVFLLLSPLAHSGDKVLVIIIDDIGHQLQHGRAAVDLPGKLNIAVLPFTAHGQALAERAHLAGKEVLLHTPMSSLSGQESGPGTLTAELTEVEFREILAQSLAQIPHVRGINNHMGSDLTRQPLQMGWLMDELCARSLYFVDSRTNHETVAASTAEEYGVPNTSRQVFLDNELDAQAIAQRFAQVLALIEKEGSAVAIGHPYPETIAYLEEVLPKLNEQGIRLALVSELLAKPPQEAYSRTSMPRAAIESFASGTVYSPKWKMLAARTASAPPIKTPSTR